MKAPAMEQQLSPLPANFDFHGKKSILYLELDSNAAPTC